MSTFEIERKFLWKKVPVDLGSQSHYTIQQAYLTKDPVIRVRHSKDHYTMTYKGGGMLAHEEYELPLTKSAYETLLAKADGNIITKTRYVWELPESDINPACKALLGDAKLVVECDVFDAPFAPLILAEIEFPSVEAAKAFQMPEYFAEDVTENPEYHNVNMSFKDLTQ